MARFAPVHALLRVTRVENRQLLSWEEGLHLRDSTGRTLDELRFRAAADRWQLAREWKRQGSLILSLNPPLYRTALGRFYYSMYHAMRAVAFIAHKGDDKQEHKTLPGATPDDFPNKTIWQNNLKSAREHRNNADYDPYPKTDCAWRKTAVELEKQSADLLKLSRDYLRGKGCKYL